MIFFLLWKIGGKKVQGESSSRRQTETWIYVQHLNLRTLMTHRCCGASVRAEQNRFLFFNIKRGDLAVQLISYSPPTVTTALLFSSVLYKKSPSTLVKHRVPQHEKYGMFALFISCRSLFLQLHNLKFNSFNTFSYLFALNRELCLFLQSLL